MNSDATRGGSYNLPSDLYSVELYQWAIDAEAPSSCAAARFSKSLAKIFAIGRLQLIQGSRLNVKIRTPERKYSSKAALYGDWISPNYLISHEMLEICSVDKVASPPTMPRPGAIK